jgi:hypothetical protein
MSRTTKQVLLSMLIYIGLLLVSVIALNELFPGSHAHPLLYGFMDGAVCGLLAALLGRWLTSGSVAYHDVWRLAFVLCFAGAWLTDNTHSNWWVLLTLAGLALLFWNRFRPIEDREDL